MIPREHDSVFGRLLKHEAQMIVAVAGCLEHSQCLIVVYLKLIPFSYVSQVILYLRIVSKRSFFSLQCLNEMLVYPGPPFICAQFILDE